MNTIQSRITMLVCLLALPVATFGAPVFSDDFSTDGSLNGMSADIGGTWSVVLNSLSASGGVVDTNASTDVGMAKASFTQALAEGEVMTLRFVTVESAGGFSFFGRAGISLYESGNEQVFMGGLGVFPVEWGIGGSAIGSSQAFSTSITAEPQTAVFEYRAS